MTSASKDQLIPGGLPMVEPCGQTGAELIETLVELTGLPKSAMEKEISSIMSQTGTKTESITLDELRGALIEYLEQLSAEEERAMLEAADSSSTH